MELVNVLGDDGVEEAGGLELGQDLVGSVRPLVLEALESLGAEYVLLDSSGDDPAATRHHEPVWRMLTTLAEKVLDLQQQTLR